MSQNNMVCWVDIPVKDLKRSIGFYSAVLGQAVRHETGPGFEYGLLPHAEDNVSGCLTPMAGVEPSDQGVLVYLNVQGRTDQAVAAAREHGGAVLEEKKPIGPYGFRALIRDTEGNRIALHAHSG